MREPSGYLCYGGIPRPREGDKVGNVNKVGCVFIFLFSYFFSLFLTLFFLYWKKKKNQQQPDTSVVEAYHVPVRWHSG